MCACLTVLFFGLVALCVQWGAMCCHALLRVVVGRWVHGHHATQDHAHSLRESSGFFLPSSMGPLASGQRRKWVVVSCPEDGASRRQRLSCQLSGHSSRQLSAPQRVTAFPNFIQYAGCHQHERGANRGHTHQGRPHQGANLVHQLSRSA